MIELLAGEAAGLGLSEIALRLGRTTGEIFRMVRALERRQYIAADGRGGYVLTLRLFELAHLHPPVRRIATIALPPMQEMARALKQSCHLAIPSGGHLLVIAQVESPANMGFSVRLGAQLGLLTTPSGNVLLAFSDPGTRAALLAPIEGGFDPAELDRRLDGIRARGHECVDSYEVRGVRPVSFPIFDVSGEVAAVLTSPYMERLDDDAIGIGAVRDALSTIAATVSRQLGAPGIRRAPSA